MAGEIGKEAPGLTKRVDFILGHIVDHSVSAVDLCAAEFFLGQGLPRGLGDDCGATGQDLG